MSQEVKYMKIEELELLSSKISNINLLNSIVETFDNVSYEVRTRLLEELKNCDYNENTYNIEIYLYHTLFIIFYLIYIFKI